MISFISEIIDDVTLKHTTGLCVYVRLTLGVYRISLNFLIALVGGGLIH